jgi:hypothetical protein
LILNFKNIEKPKYFDISNSILLAHVKKNP